MTRNEKLWEPPVKLFSILQTLSGVLVHPISIGSSELICEVLAKVGCVAGYTALLERDQSRQEQHSFLAAEDSVSVACRIRHKSDGRSFEGK